MSFSDYKSFWNDKARTAAGALAAVDGSSDEAVVQHTGAFAARQMRAALEIAAADRILELGCGVARIGRALAPDCAFWHGVDIAENMVQVARERLVGHGNTAVDAIDGPRLDRFESASFDKAYSVAVFIHMDKEDLYLYLEELRRVVKPGGRIYFDVWNLEHPVGWRRFAYELNAYRNAATDARKDVARNQFCVPSEIQVYLREAGLETLSLIDDSPYLQVVARVPGGPRSLAEDQAAVAARRDEIAYGPIWSQLFDALLEVLFLGRPPRALLQDIDAATPQRPEHELFRIWLQACWRANPDLWGPEHRPD